MLHVQLINTKREDFAKIVIISAHLVTEKLMYAEPAHLVPEKMPPPVIVKLAIITFLTRQIVLSVIVVVRPALMGLLAKHVNLVYI